MNAEDRSRILPDHFCEMVEQTRALSPERWAEEQLLRLGLCFDDLEKRDIVELGPGYAVLSRVAALRSLFVRSLDNESGDWGEELDIPDGIGYEVGDAFAMPYEDTSVDLFVSNGAIPFGAPIYREDMSRLFAEVKRVLRPGGEFRFGPVNGILTFDSTYHASDEARIAYRGAPVDFPDEEAYQAYVAVENQIYLDWLNSFDHDLEFTLEEGTPHEVQSYLKDDPQYTQDGDGRWYYYPQYIKAVKR